MNTHKLPAHVVLLYANKLYLFLSYWIAYLVTQQNEVLGVPLVMLLLYGHANFISTIK